MLSRINHNPYQYPVLNQQKQVNNVVPFKNNQEPGQKKPFIFVGMPMPNPIREPEKRRKWDELYKIIKNLATPRKAVARRIDDIMNESLEQGNGIERRITNAIDDSDVVIVDITEENPNVYFEYGYAKGKDKIIIPIAKYGTKLPFDIRNNHTIFYDTYDKKGAPLNLQEDLGKSLSNLLKTVKKEIQN